MSTLIEAPPQTQESIRSNSNLKQNEDGKPEENEESLPDTQPDWHGHISESDLTLEKPLRYTYCLWYMKRVSRSDYSKNIKCIGSFNTLQGFWRIYNHILRPNNVPNGIDYHIFKSGIKPMWEDPENCKGGKWIIRLKKGLASHYWEEILFAIIGEQFHMHCIRDICGAVISIRYNEDIISLWNHTADDKEILYKLRDHLRIILDLPYFVQLEYKRHDASLVDNSSFRNTTVWRANNSIATSGNNRTNSSSNVQGSGNVNKRYTTYNTGNTRNQQYHHRNSSNNEHPGTYGVKSDESNTGSGHHYRQDHPKRTNSGDKE